jgi:hypothetical protein
MVKVIYSWKPVSRRPIGRPKIRWEDDVRKYIQKLKCQIGRTLSRIEEDGRNWLKRPKLCIKSCTAIIIIRRSTCFSMAVRNKNCAGISAVRPGPYHVSRMKNNSKIARSGCSTKEGEKKERRDKTKIGQK